MKIVAVFLFATSILWAACNSEGNKENKIPENSVENSQHEHAKESTGLVLNNGAKWKADSATNLNVQLLKDIVTNTRREKIEDYHIAANKLNEALDKMVSECTMKGPDHEALHQWLEPLIEKVSELKKSSETRNADLVFNEIERHINLYRQYFE